MGQTQHTCDSSSTSSTSSNGNSSMSINTRPANLSQQHGCFDTCCWMAGHKHCWALAGLTAAQCIMF